jgi:hypothetical protein
METKRITALQRTALFGCLTEKELVDIRATSGGTPLQERRDAVPFRRGGEMVVDSFRSKPITIILTA